jgi:hypothetical protein
VLSKLVQYDQQLKDVTEKHQQETIGTEREHQEKVFIAIFLLIFPSHASIDWDLSSVKQYFNVLLAPE